MLLRLLVVSLQMTVVAGCATAKGPAFVPNEYYALKEDLRAHTEKAVVYVYRRDPLAPFQTFSLRINGEPVSELGIYGYYQYFASPGRMTFSLEYLKATLPVQIEGGKAYFVRVRWGRSFGPPWPFLELVSDEITALNDLDQCRQMQAEDR